MLGGGIIVGEVTEFCGVPGVGKTQLGMQLACDVQIPSINGGLEGAAIYIDTEGSLMPERLATIAEGLIERLRMITMASSTSVSEKIHEDQKEALKQVTREKILKNVHVYRVYDYVEQISCLKSLPTFLETHPEIRLIVLDSVAFHFRRGFDDMALRARLLTGMAQSLLDLAERFQLAVVVINQVTTKIDESKQESSHLAPALGESWAHACTNRVMFYWGSDGQRYARLLKSPSCRETFIVYQITSEGVRDVEDNQNGKKKEINWFIGRLLMTDLVMWWKRIKFSLTYPRS